VNAIVQRQSASPAGLALSVTAKFAAILGSRLAPIRSTSNATATECCSANVNKNGGPTMLVLSRKENERLQIGDEIILTITAIKGSCVSVGIEAPKDVAIQRSELRQAQTDVSLIK
jgi:carbon storage regulator CsrA